MQSNPIAEYWDGFYLNRIRQGPSQFAALVLGELSGNGGGVIDVGCGDGRDSFFFAEHGVPVIGIDQSGPAIAANARDANEAAHRGVRLEFRVDSIGLSSNLNAELRARAGEVAIYGRFFLHAIEASAESQFLSDLKTGLTSGDRLFLEYRTLADARSQKRFDGHYRRFIDHKLLCGQLQEIGMDVDYEAEGLGFAKFGAEDPHVGRVFATKL